MLYIDYKMYQKSYMLYSSKQVELITGNISLATGERGIFRV